MYLINTIYTYGIYHLGKKPVDAHLDNCGGTASTFDIVHAKTSK